MQQQLPIVIECPAPDRAGCEPPSSEPGARRGDDWRIDDRSRRAGLRGLARARAALDATGAARQSCRADAA